MSLSIYKSRAGQILHSPKCAYSHGFARGLPRDRSFGGVSSGLDSRLSSGASLGQPPPAPAARTAQPPSTPGRCAQAPRPISSDHHLSRDPSPRRDLAALGPLRRPPPTWPAPHFRPFRPHPSRAAVPGALEAAPPAPQRRPLLPQERSGRPAGLWLHRPGLERTRVGSGLGGARRAARLARRSPRPAPRASARPRPRPGSAPNFGPAAPCPSAGSRPRPGPALRLSPAHSVLLSQVQTPHNPAPNCGPAHFAPLSQVQTPPQLRPALQPRPSRTDLAGFPVRAVSTSARPTSLKCHPILSSVQSTAPPLPLRGPQHRPRPHPRTLPLLSSRARPPPSPQGSVPQRVAPPHLSTSRPFLT